MPENNTPKKMYAVLDADSKGSIGVIAVYESVEKIDDKYAGKAIAVYTKAYTKSLVVKKNLSLAAV